MEETSHAVENVAAGEKATENLGIAAVNPLAADLKGVLALDDGEVVTNVGAIEELVNGGLEKERLAETEVGGKTHSGIRDAGRADGAARTGFASVGEVGFVEHAVGKSAKPVGADGLDFRGAFDAVGGGAVGGDVKGLVGVLGPVEIIGAEDLILGVEVVVDAPENGRVPNLVDNGKAFVRVFDRRREGCVIEEIEKREALALGAGGNCGVGDVTAGAEHRAGDAAGSSERDTEVLAGEVFANTFASGEEEQLVLDKRAAEAAAELVAAEIIERLAVGGGGGEGFRAEVLKGAAVNVVGARLGDDVDDPACGAAEFGIGAAGHHLEFSDCFEGDVDSSALAAHLLAEEAIVVITAIEADVVEDAALAIDVDFIAVRTLGNADAGGQGEQVFKFTTQNGRLGDGGLIERRRTDRFGDLDDRDIGGGDLLGDSRNLHGHRDGDDLTDGELHILLEDGGEAGLADGELIAARREAQKGEVAIRIGFVRLCEIGIEILGFHRGAGNASAALIDDIPLHGAAGGLRRRPSRRGTRQ